MTIFFTGGETEAKQVKLLAEPRVEPEDDSGPQPPQRLLLPQLRGSNLGHGVVLEAQKKLQPWWG